MKYPRGVDPRGASRAQQAEWLRLWNSDDERALIKRWFEAGARVN